MKTGGCLRQSVASGDHQAYLHKNIYDIHDTGAKSLHGAIYTYNILTAVATARQYNAESEVYIWQLVVE